MDPRSESARVRSPEPQPPVSARRRPLPVGPKSPPRFPDRKGRMTPTSPSRIPVPTSPARRGSHCAGSPSAGPGSPRASSSREWITSPPRKRGSLRDRSTIRPTTSTGAGNPVAVGRERATVAGEGGAIHAPATAGPQASAAAPNPQKKMSKRETRTQKVVRYRKEVEEGNPDAQFKLGELYRLGDWGVEKDEAEAVRLFTLAAEQSHVKAQINLANMYNKGHGVEQNTTLAVKWYESAAATGAPVAQFNLGNTIDPKDDRMQESESDEGLYNPAEAARWFRLAAEQGVVHAQLKCGLKHRDGDGVAIDMTQSAIWLTRAAAQGNADAQFSLGVAYSLGHGVKQDFVHAVEMFRKAAEQKHAYAILSLGAAYAYGKGVEKDSKSAIKCYKSAARLGCSDAQYIVGDFHFVGKGTRQCYASSAKYFKDSADQGNVLAMCRMGLAYKHGHGVKQDHEKALEYYQRAASHGSIDAYCNLGYAYLNGKGVQRNHEEAVKWYKLAAAQGAVVAQFHLGNAFFTGKGVTQDYRQASKWFTQAASKGHALAQDRLEMMKDLGFRPDGTRDSNWQQRAAEPPAVIIFPQPRQQVSNSPQPGKLGLGMRRHSSSSRAGSIKR